MHKNRSNEDYTALYKEKFPIYKIYLIYRKNEEIKEITRQWTINNYRNKGEKVKSKQNFKHFENRLNNKKGRNEGDKKGKRNVWGSGWCGEIIAYIQLKILKFTI